MGPWSAPLRVIPKLVGSISRDEHNDHYVEMMAKVCATERDGWILIDDMLVEIEEKERLFQFFVRLRKASPLNT